MELSIESPCQDVTWKVRDFFQLPSEVGYSLDSPKFRFADESYCLRLYPNGAKMYGDTNHVLIFLVKVSSSANSFLVRLTSSVTKRNVLCKLGQKRRNEKGNESVTYQCSSTFNPNFGFRLSRSLLEEDSDEFVPDGTLTLLCSMHVEKQSTGSPQTDESESSEAEEEQEGLPSQSAFFLSRWRSSKMELSVESPCQYVTCKVRDFFQLPSEVGFFLESPEFCFAGDRYCLRFYPNGDENADTHDIDHQLVRLTYTFPERIVTYKVGCRWRNKGGYEMENYNSQSTSNNELESCVSRSILAEDKDTYVKDGIFTVLCSMHLEEQTSAGSPQSQEAGISQAEDEELPGVAKLQTDYMQLLQKGSESDACFVVSGKEFRAHRCVLRARSTVFEAMFGHETTEKESGLVVIDDLDPESFGKFLEYLYTGIISPSLSEDNAFGLYAAADKYDVPTLKSECVAYMRRTLSVDSFCDVMTVALRHHEEDLLQQAIEFFKENLQRIILTVKWQQFVIDNGTSANELLIKAFVPRRE